MIYTLEARTLEKRDDGKSIGTCNDVESYVPIPFLIDATSTKEAFEFAKAMIADIYDGDVAVEVASTEEFPIPSYDGRKQEDCRIVVEAWRINGEWSYCV